MGTGLLIIGEILLKLLELIGILLLVIVLLLVLPFRYKICGEYKEEKLYIKGRIMWAFGICFCPFSYDEKGGHWKIRVFGIDAGRCLEKWKKRKVHRKKRSTSPKTEKTVHIKEEKNVHTKAEKTALPEAEEMEESEEKTPVSKGQSKRKSEKKTKRKKWVVRLKKILSADTRSALKQSTVSLKAVICILKDNVIHLWGKIKPKVVRGTIEFGTKDPCTTGQILGVCAFFYRYYAEGLTVIPDFEEEKLQAEILVKGKIRIATLLFIAVRVLLSQELKRFRSDMERVKKIEIV